MQLADTIVAVVGDIAVLAAVWLAYLALRTAKAARTEAADAERVARLDRHRQRVVRVGEAIEGLGSVGWRDPFSWTSRRDHLAAALVGLSDRLPSCAEVLNETGAEKVHVAAMVAHDEVLRELRWIDAQLPTLLGGTAHEYSNAGDPGRPARSAIGQ